jgi:hypothetical protein
MIQNWKENRTLYGVEPLKMIMDYIVALCFRDPCCFGYGDF